MKYLKNVVTLKYDASRCTGCGRCLEVCPHGVFAAQDGRVAITDRDACMECGACQRNCPFAAITVSTGAGCANAVLKSRQNGSSSACNCSADADTSSCG